MVDPLLRQALTPWPLLVLIWMVFVLFPRFLFISSTATEAAFLGGSTTRAPQLAPEERWCLDPACLCGGPSLLRALPPGPSNKGCLVVQVHYVWAFCRPGDTSAFRCPGKSDPEMPTGVFWGGDKGLGLYSPTSASHGMRLPQEVTMTLG